MTPGTAERKKETIEVWNVCECGRTLHSMHEGKRGQCASCWVKAMPADTKSAINRLFVAAFREDEPTDEEKDDLIEDAMSKLNRDGTFSS